MEASQLPPERIMLPPSPAESVESVDSTATATERERGKAERAEDVMITLSVTPERPAPSRTTRPPFPRSHFRSRSLAEVPGVPPMMRAHSSPGLDSRGRYIFVNGHGMPTNLPDTPSKRFVPLQVATAENFQDRMGSLNISSETISEHAVLDTPMRSPSYQGESHATSPVMVPHHTFPRMGRRRPTSPLNFHTMNGNNQPVSSPPSGHSSPMMIGTKYNESFPGYSASSNSSMPSTPTSLRSRSPSISSLETIPDIPDAEAAATEADQIAALKMAADKADEAESANNSGTRRRGTSDASGPSAFPTMRAGSGGYAARADKRKRWSVCGAERRQDLDLETIWED
ncbi:hypothetical protein ASPWEDRAFT_169199 [Aspergillus wentii DTO 134E9]|uniref:Basic proline-rich protein n=1 Tax=Aspergillus wentii DTO 134E9 TaxID=1073089 RepID=A0A1L9RWP4_ASPWE|nr:uncharacterized protein ASPWEDRAFT_169199 [Aspergillus wentii DTO 134E9]KAI9928967.1 hypothetical protein MW887_001360 [Aspergillus wentii]OJJ39346.1 hypothetical protein ASPWEDRAFT_169199 [Aspergillus wentii DTO 134E9]